MSTRTSFKNFYLKFYLLLIALSIPFWVLGALAERLSKYLPMNLPLSALMAFCPMITVFILVHKEEKIGGINRLLKRIFDPKRIKRKIWYVPIFLIMPLFMLLTYGVMRLIGRPLPEPEIALWSIPILFVVFLLPAIGEEIGWMGYAAEPMLSRWSALKTSLILGAIWGIWHIIPYVQMGKSFNWILWQCITSIFLRVIIVWLYNNNGKSVLAAILFHTMINVSNTLFPNNSSHYDPSVTGPIAAIAAMLITLLWGSKKLSRYH
jgi:uncharacterized protein